MKGSFNIVVTSLTNSFGLISDRQAVSRYMSSRFVKWDVVLANLLSRGAFAWIKLSLLNYGCAKHFLTETFLRPE